MANSYPESFVVLEFLQVYWSRADIPQVSNRTWMYAYLILLLLLLLLLFLLFLTYRYIYRLADLHKQNGNFVEAAFTLLLHAELLQVSWS